MQVLLRLYVIAKSLAKKLLASALINMMSESSLILFIQLLNIYIFYSNKLIVYTN